MNTKKKIAATSRGNVDRLYEIIMFERRGPDDLWDRSDGRHEVIDRIALNDEEARSIGRSWLRYRGRDDKQYEVIVRRASPAAVARFLAGKRLELKTYVRLLGGKKVAS